MNKRIIFILLGLFIILFSKQIFYMFNSPLMDINFTILGICTILLFGLILSLIGIFYPFKDSSN